MGVSGMYVGTGEVAIKIEVGIVETGKDTTSELNSSTTVSATQDSELGLSRIDLAGSGRDNDNDNDNDEGEHGAAVAGAVSLISFTSSSISISFILSDLSFISSFLSFPKFKDF